MLANTTESGTWSSGLDPGTNSTGSANALQEQAIYGGLFLMRADNDGSNARIVPNQAESAKLSADLKTLTIKLRPGITFSDGTPFNAQAVVWNLKRDFGSKCGCGPQWKVRENSPFTAPDPLTVVIHMAEPDAAVIRTFPLINANWIVSPTAFQKMGEKQFRVKPVGAGPFVVVSDQLSSKLVLERNPHFFKADQGLPYLDKLTFKSVGGGDQAAYQALLAGAAGAYERMTSPALIKQAESSSKLTATTQPGTTVYTVQFNTMSAPFNNKKAREAVAYATDWDAINKGLFNGNAAAVEGFTTPDGLFYHQHVAGYRSYDLDKAKRLVEELGGLSFQIFAGKTPVYTTMMTALQTQWEKAGMHVEIKAEELAAEIKTYNGGKWQASMIHMGAWDPAGGLGLKFRVGSDSPFTGVKDPHLDMLLHEGIVTGDNAQRAKIYQEIGEYLVSHVLVASGLARGPSSIAAKGVQGPGLTTALPLGGLVYPIWSEVWRQ